MRLVKHVARGYGHARQLLSGKWEVHFFDDYDQICLFSEHPDPTILTFCSEENEHV